jgi:hypothetical protein
MTLVMMALDAECCYAYCHLCCVAFMLSVASKLYMLNVVVLNVVMLIVVMLGVVMLNVVAPLTRTHRSGFWPCPLTLDKGERGWQ